MAKEKNSFVLYYELEDILYDLSDSQIAELFRAIFAYEKRGEVYSGSDPEVKIAVRFVMRSLDDNDERYRSKVEKRREAGRKGGLKSAQVRKQKKQNKANEANVSKGKQTKQSQANQADPDPVPDPDPDPVPESVGASPPTRARVEQQAELPSQKVQWADNVTMTNDEHRKLLDAYGPADTALMIEHLSHYKASHNRHYDDDYETILSWVVNWLSEQKRKTAQAESSQRVSRAPVPMTQATESMEEQEQRILNNERWMREFLDQAKREEESQ